MDIRKWKQSLPTSGQCWSYWLVFIFLFFAGLLLQNPFSGNTIISDLPPLPDSLQYINPARSLVEGKGLRVTRIGRGIPLSSPPLYSLLLAPFMALTSDPRVFYLANVFLAIISLLLFFRLLMIVIENKWVVLFVLCLYITNPSVYTLPILVLAENLLLPLFLIGAILLVKEVSFKNSFFAGIIAISFYATKYAAAPLAVTFSCLYLIKILYSCRRSVRLKMLVLFVGGFLLVYLPFEVYEYTAKGQTLLTALRTFIVDLATNTPETAFDGEVQIRYFSLVYFSKHFILYLRALVGLSAGNFTPRFPGIFPFALICSWIGLLAGFLSKQFRFMFFSLVMLLFAGILFLATFYYVDPRYIIYSIPILLLGFAFFLNLIYALVKHSRVEKYYYIELALLLLVYTGTLLILYPNIPNRLSAQEYHTVVTLNNYFSKPAKNNRKQPIVLTVVPPHFIDFYSNGNYQLLPLSHNQVYMYKLADVVYGPNDYSDLIKLYETYLKRGYDLYTQKSYLLKISRLQKTYLKLRKKFNLQLVAAGCNGNCNLYKVIPNDNR